ncbi:hypothetical protein HPP92_005077 [Vanilla planifolia]|uniref:Plastid lipid-associated protein/fibrillin conserved domain-containing protein n=1 Tax=Vanilla planifolia TaxID=51239 RepID=A0A835RP08_VANPL|nr:hypothetical protein HPP92_005077 [Vanilla planifolia]
MASRLPPSALLSPSQFRPADSSLCRTFVSPGVRNISAVLIQREQSNNLSPCSRKRQHNGSALRAALGESAVLEPPPTFRNPGPDVVSLKLKLLSAVSGLNRGLAASEDDLKRADTAAKELEDTGGVVDLNKDLDKLQGKWKLIYSSAFSSRTLGGSRPGPPIGRLIPITLGQVFQRIDVLSKDFDNIVELQFGTPWPLPPIGATATLAHKFELIGTAKIKITFEKTTVKPTGSLSQVPPLDIPRLPDALRPTSNTGAGEFEVTYLDSDFRITRGDRGELRVFVSS